MDQPTQSVFLYRRKGSPGQPLRGRQGIGYRGSGTRKKVQSLRRSPFDKLRATEAISFAAWQIEIAALPSVAPKKQLVSPPSTGGDKGEGE